MARAKNGSNVRRIVKNRWFVLIAIVVLVLFTIYRIVVFINHKNDQRLLLEDLERSGEILDEVAKDFVENIPELNPTRHEYCYRASRKFEKGPIYCGQSLEVQENNLAESVLYDIVEYIKKYLLNTNRLSFVDYGSENKNYSNYYAETGHANGGCNSIIYTKTSLRDFEFKLECLSSEFDSFIYPELADYKF